MLKIDEVDLNLLISKYKDKGYTVVKISGKELRKELCEGKPIDERIMRRPVSQILEDYYAGGK